MTALVLSALSLAGEPGRALEAALLNHLPGSELGDVTRMAVKPCLGCSHCGTRKPGICVHTDEFSAVFARIPHHPLLVLAGPVRFGVWHPDLKRAVDRFMPLMNGLYTLREGELHHQPRYALPQRILGIGITVADGDAPAVERLVERHRRNFALLRQASLAGSDPAALVPLLPQTLSALEAA